MSVEPVPSPFREEKAGGKYRYVVRPKRQYIYQTTHLHIPRRFTSVIASNVKIIEMMINPFMLLQMRVSCLLLACSLPQVARFILPDSAKKKNIQERRCRFQIDIYRSLIRK